MPPVQPPRPPGEDAIRPHTYDGIEEYDKRLPNWWLYTLYGSIVFSIGYWFVYHVAPIGEPDGVQVDHELTRLAAVKLASSLDVRNDALFYDMSRNPNFTEAGKQTYNSLCAACHLSSLRGKSDNPGAVGPDLTDAEWLYGGKPKEIYHTVANGILAKGMPAWEPVLGQRKSAEVVAYILSRQPDEGAPPRQAAHE